MSGAKNDAVHLQQARSAGLDDMQPSIVDLFITHPSHHLHPAFGQICAVNPTGGFTQARAHFLGLALQQKDLTGGRGDLWHHAFDAATGLKAHINAPFLHEGLDILTGRGAAMDQIFADIKADATGANHRNARTDGRA